MTVGTFGVATNGVNIQNTSIIIGNTSANATLSYNLVQVSNSSFVANVSPNGLVVGGTSVNSIQITSTNIVGNTLNIANTASFTDVVTFNSDYAIQVVANSDLGTTTASPVLIYSFPKTSYSGAKILVRAKSLTGNTQVSEMVLSQNQTDAYITIYATVVSPLGANVGNFTAAINNANVELSFQQAAINSSIKLSAHLIK